MARQSSKLCRRVATHIATHWIATVAMLPRDDKKHHTQFPSMEGCRAAAGWSEKPRKCHIFVIASVTWQSLFCCCVARALMRPVRILVFVQTALSLVFTYSDSLRATQWRGNPVNKKVPRASPADIIKLDRHGRYTPSR